jgi:hypothetical protein
MADCAHCGRPLVPNATGTMHVWCWRHVHWDEPLANMIQCGSQCHHAPGAVHGVYLYTSGEKMLMARVLGYYPAGTQEVTVTSNWDVA